MQEVTNAGLNACVFLRGIAVVLTALDEYNRRMAAVLEAAQALLVSQERHWIR